MGYSHIVSCGKTQISIVINYLKAQVFIIFNIKPNWILGEIINNQSIESKTVFVNPSERIEKLKRIFIFFVAKNNYIYFFHLKSSSDFVVNLIYWIFGILNFNLGSPIFNFFIKILKFFLNVFS